MGRKSKYSKELKLEIIKRYLSGESASQLVNEYSIHCMNPSSLVGRWSKQFLAMGESAFDDKKGNRSYSKELKLMAIKDYLNGEGSYETIANKYGILKDDTLRYWVLKYNSHIRIDDYNPKPEVYMAKSRKTSEEDRIEIVNYCLENNKDYKGTAIEYGVNYAQVYSWVNKFKEMGPDGLKDGRGRKKLDSELTDIEKLKRENERLQAKNKYLEMENEALKKLEEIERMMVKDQYKK